MRNSLLAIAIIPMLALACFADGDGDGVQDDYDCNPEDASIAPGANELCNGIDDDCDGVVDEEPTDASTFYLDNDGDGYGLDQALASIQACEAPEGYVAEAADCNDQDNAIYPGAPEEDCTDPIDYNCDGSTGFDDIDDDGVPACEDCDDTRSDVFPGAAEVCDEDNTDEDCDGEINEAGADGESVWFQDSDSDGFGNASVQVVQCFAPDGYVTDATDCDDTWALAYPGGAEVCDGYDNDCNGDIDGPDSSDAQDFYADGDGDTYGAGPALRTCVAPTGFVLRSDDCDDSRANVYPGLTEVCDGLDNNCDGDADEGVLITYYVDSDSDGYGSDTIKTDACSAPSGYVDVGGDCIDTNASVNPAATEICNMGIDDDCDGSADDTDSSLDLSTRTTWYLDSDGDDFGDPDTSRTTCAMPTSHVADDSDCDDVDADVNPDADEIWYDGVDQDCDGESDYDQDGDGFDSVDYSGTDEDDTDPFCRKNCVPEGLTQADAGASCEDILADYSSATDGTYWIDPNDDGDTTDAFQVVCDMTNGGWTQCLEFENTSAEDLTNNTWFDDCVDYTSATWSDDEVRIVLENTSGTVLYDEDGTRPSGWTNAQLTSTAAVSNQYLASNHSRLVTLSNTDKLFISGNTASNSGYGGSFGNGYAIVVYPATPNYFSNPKMIVASYRQYVGFTGLRQFRGWSTSSEIAGTGNTSFSTSTTSPAQLGTVTFWVR